MIYTRSEPTHTLLIAVPLNMDANPAAEGWDTQAAFVEAIGAILPLIRVGTLGLLCDQIQVTLEDAEPTV